MLANPVFGVLSLLLPIATITVVRLLRGRPQRHERASPAERIPPGVDFGAPERSPSTGLGGFVKRAFDVGVAGIVLLLTSPLLLLVAVGVKLSSPGPILFRLPRYGLNNEKIIVYKFRSMVAPESGSAMRQASAGDARITRFGAFLRRTSLDELPQFINVLQGRMSIVGPRPHAAAQSEQYRQLLKDYMVRHNVRPGITGWAQANGYNDETAGAERLERSVFLDIQYVRHWSLVLDLRVLALTLKRRIFRT